MNARQKETATLIERVRRVLREPRKLLEQKEVQLKQPQHLERNREIARKISGNHRQQSQEIGLRTVTARVSLRSVEQKTQTLPRGKGRRIIKSKTMPKGTVKKVKPKEDKVAEKGENLLLYRLCPKR